MMTILSAPNFITDIAKVMTSKWAYFRACFMTSFQIHTNHITVVFQPAIIENNGNKIFWTQSFHIYGDC